MIGSAGYTAIEVSKGGAPEIANNSIFNGKAAAIEYIAESGDSGEVNIHGNLIEGAEGGGILVSTVGSTVTDSPSTGMDMSGATH